MEEIFGAELGTLELIDCLLDPSAVEVGEDVLVEMPAVGIDESGSGAGEGNQEFRAPAGVMKEHAAGDLQAEEDENDGPSAMEIGPEQGERDKEPDAVAGQAAFGIEKPEGGEEENQGKDVGPGEIVHRGAADGKEEDREGDPDMSAAPKHPAEGEHGYEDKEKAGEKSE